MVWRGRTGSQVAGISSQAKKPDLRRRTQQGMGLAALPSQNAFITTHEIAIP
jgi:hypothetical protein